MRRNDLWKAAAVLFLCTAAIGMAQGPTGTDEKPLMAEQVHKNIQVLKGLPENEFMETMGFFSASLGANCTYCHVAESSGSWAKYADDNEHKKIARSMIVMVVAINRTYFGGKRMLTCYSCHHGDERPPLTPSIANVYGSPPIEEPDEIDEAPGAPPIDQILDKYIQALGGAQRLAGLTSFDAKGLYQGYGDDVDKRPAEVYAKAPGQRATIAHAMSGDLSTIYDGRIGWIAAPETDRPVPVLALTGGDLDGAKMDAALTFPAGIKQALTDWRVGYPSAIDDRAVQVVQGKMAGRTTVHLFFDKQTGLLVRQVRFTNSRVGLSPTQIDYADYREVAGVKMPFKWTVSWLDGRTTIELTDVQPNVAVDPAKFGKPAAPQARR